MAILENNPGELAGRNTSVASFRRCGVAVGAAAQGHNDIGESGRPQAIDAYNSWREWQVKDSLGETWAEHGASVSRLRLYGGLDARKLSSG